VIVKWAEVIAIAVEWIIRQQTIYWYIARYLC